MSAVLGLDGRRGLVLVGTSEIGAACVERLRGEGMMVAFTGADPERGGSLAGQTGATFIECSTGDRTSCDRAVQQALELGGGRLDVLVTGAGEWLSASIESTPESDFRELVETNLTAPFRVARACMAPMRAHGGGSMIHIASDAGIRADHEMAAYSVAAAGVIAATELFAAEGAPDGIRANAVCPSDEIAGADVAAAVAWLACDDSAHVSGATLRIDAGTGAAMVIDTRT